MTRRADLPRTRAEFLASNGVLLVVRETPPAPPTANGQPAFIAGNPIEGDEILLAVWDDGSACALNGHVDLGTGIQTALGQIVAEELDLGMPCVRVMLGDTARAPNQGATIASASIQIHAQPLRLAAAQARAWLVARAAERLGVDVDALQVRNGVVRVTEAPDRHVGYAELVAGQRTVLRLDPQAQPKDPADYRVVGTRQARVDIPAKLAGDLVFVHDMRVPGMLHGRVVRPPYAGIDAGPFYCDAAFSNTVEAIANSLREAGIRANVRPLERAAFYKAFSDKKLKGLIMGGSAAFGNAATRLEAFVVKGGAFAYRLLVSGVGPPVAWCLTGSRDHRRDQHEHIDRKPFGDQRCGERAERLGRDHQVGAVADRVDHRVGVVGQRGRFVVSRQVGGDAVVPTGA